MHEQIKKADMIILVLMLFMIFLSCSGCSLISSNKVIIDKQFLNDIEKAFQEESKSGVDKSEVYNQIWDKHYYDLIYLAQKGDLQGISASILLIGQKGDPTCLFEEIELLAKPTIKSNPSYFWQAMEKADSTIQCMALYRLSGYLSDEKLKHYLNSHQETGHCFYEYERKIREDIEKSETNHEQ
jgi:hypothetical protein